MIFSAIIGGCVEIFQILLSKTNFDINTVYISKEKLLMKFKKELLEANWKTIHFMRNTSEDTELQ